MKPLSGKEFAKAIVKRGWRLLRVEGSHHIYGKEGTAVRLSVPIHGSRPLKIGLQRHLTKMAGLSHDEIG